MLRYIAVSVLLALSLAAPSLWDKEWSVFKETHSKQYSQGEEPIRRAIWESNVKMIQQHNLEADRGVHSYRLGMNHLGDMKPEEMEGKVKGYTHPAKRAPRSSGDPFKSAIRASDLPSEVDWRKKGYVTPVKNQGTSCSSSYAFSATGSLEGQHFRKTGKLVSLSEQNLLDCSYDEGNLGCNGGTVDQAYRYARWNGGVDTEKSYPYTATVYNVSCQFRLSDVGATLVGWSATPPGNETALRTAVALEGPVSVGLGTSISSFRFYKSGLYDDVNCEMGVNPTFALVVGYGSDASGKDYWLVKNSWGTSWGVDGYILIARGKENICNIASLASYPLV